MSEPEETPPKEVTKEFEKSLDRDISVWSSAIKTHIADLDAKARVKEALNGH